MTRDPVTGPLTREKLAELASAPFGEARKEIRKFDPFFGRAPGEKIRWRVTVEVDQTGEAYVEAASEEEANKLADDLTIGGIDFDYCDTDFTVISVEPYVEK